MKIGIISLPGAGKSTVFEALTRQSFEPGRREESLLGTIDVPDRRVDELSSIFNPKKTIYAKVSYFLPGMSDHKQDAGIDAGVWAKVRDCDALIYLVRNFILFGFEEPQPYNDFTKLDSELILSDLLVAEKRIERLELDKKRGKNVNRDELVLLKECRKMLENETPLRRDPNLASSFLLRGYAFLSAKPVLVLFNNDEEDDTLPELFGLNKTERCTIIKGKLEQELLQMSDEEAEEFLIEFNITASAMDRVIKESYKLMGLISFFTVGSDEVKAWTIKKGTKAIDAAEVIHSDIKKGFIKAEVVSYNDLINAGNYNQARKKGDIRLEGKNYEVSDGDIINFRFNV